MNAAAEFLKTQRVPMGAKPNLQATGRLAEASRLTTLMSSEKGFSFVRLGDKDVSLLLYPDATATQFNGAQSELNGTTAYGTPGLNANQTDRLRRAVEIASYVDFWECQWKNDDWIRELNLNRAPNTHRNPNRETSFILGTWLEHEFKRYCTGRRVLFCGAEAPLLEQLSKQEGFREWAQAFWPKDFEAFYLRPREDGRNLAANLEAIKADLREMICRYKIDTLFLSLGGGAKIICQELAEELKICAFDFGVGLRSLTYSGSGGYLASRATHLIFLYRVPFGIYMDALQAAYPGLKPEVVLAKAHAQLLLEVQEKEVGWTHSAWENDFSPENLAAFQQGVKEYKKRYRHLFRHSPVTIKERKDFLHFCGTHQLTAEGIRFLKWFNLKSWLKSKLA
jgi:hypothetical protein